MDRHRVAHRWYYAELLTLCLSPAAPVHRASVGYSAASLRGQMSAVGDFVHTVPEQRPLEAPARDLADCRQLQALQMMRRVHPLVKDANNRDAVVGDSEINHMPLDIAAAIARSNMITRRSGLRRFVRLGMPRSAGRCIAQPALVPTLGACISRCLPSRARRRGKVGTQPFTRRSLRLKAFASKRFGFPLFSPSIKAERIFSISAPRSCSRRMRSRMYSLSLV